MGCLVDTCCRDDGCEVGFMKSGEDVLWLFGWNQISTNAFDTCLVDTNAFLHLKIFVCVLGYFYIFDTCYFSVVTVASNNLFQTYNNYYH